jgi:hypothetical protein
MGPKDCHKTSATDSPSTPPNIPGDRKYRPNSRGGGGALSNLVPKNYEFNMINVTPHHSITHTLQHTTAHQTAQHSTLHTHRNTHTTPHYTAHRTPQHNTLHTYIHTKRHNTLQHIAAHTAAVVFQPVLYLTDRTSTPRKTTRSDSCAAASSSSRRRPRIASPSTSGYIVTQMGRVRS